MAVSIPKIGVQLFTLKNEFTSDPFGILQQVADIGFEGVEFVGSSLRSIDLNRLNNVLTENGLKVAGATFEIEKLVHDLDSILRLCNAISCPAVVLPSIRPSDCLNRKTVADVALKMNYIASRCKSEGIAFLYHTHGLEFQIVDGRSGMEWLSASWDERLVRLEPDTYWIEHAGLDAVDFIRQYGSRCSSIHFKDMKNRTDKRDAEVGTGVIDMDGVAKEAMRHNVQWFIVEQEEFDRPPMESIKVSYRNLSALINQAAPARGNAIPTI